MVIPVGSIHCPACGQPAKGMTTVRLERADGKQAVTSTYVHDGRQCQEKRVE